MPPRLEFFFFLGSTYSHLSVHRAGALAQASGVELVWRPFSVRTLMREQNNSPFVGKPVKLRYMWRDVERRTARFGVPFDGIPPYPIDPDELANRVATLAALLERELAPEMGPRDNVSALSADKAAVDSAIHHARDIQAGRNAGMRTIAATYGYLAPDEAVAGWQADYQADSVAAIAHILFTDFLAD